MANQYLLLFLTILTGFFLGRIRMGKNFNLGVSGCMFTGLVLGWWTYRTYAQPHLFLYQANPLDPSIPQAARLILRNGLVANELFYIFLMLFVAAVGLLAARDLGPVVRKYGLKFAVLGGVVTFTGAVSTYLLSLLIPGQSTYAISGAYTGALTSSPGLGAALESVARKGAEAQAAVGAGYAIAYPFGVLVVILGIQFIPRLFGIDLEKEKAEYSREVQKSTPIHSAFDLPAFMATGLIGYLLGSLQVSLGPLGKVGLGSTGGILLAGLILGFIGKIGPLNFRMDPQALGTIRSLALAFFLAIVGLQNGHGVVSALADGGLYLAGVASLAGILAILSGLLLGRYVFKINWVLLAGALCGGMTSTPGLGVSIDALGSDDPAAGYGATYPFALVGMVIFTILLQTLA